MNLEGFSLRELWSEIKTGAMRRNGWFVMIWRHAKGHAVLLPVQMFILLVWAVAAIFAEWAKWLLAAALLVTAVMLAYDLMKKQTALAILTGSAFIMEAVTAVIVFGAQQLWSMGNAIFNPCVCLYLLVLIAECTAPRVLYPNHVR